MKKLKGFVYLVLSGYTQAAEYNSCGYVDLRWFDDNVTLRFDQTTFPNNEAWRTHAESMLNEWNNVNGSNFTFHTATDTGGVLLNNNEREVWFEDLGDPIVLGRTTLYWSNYCNSPYYNTQYFNEVDIVMNSSPIENWSFDPVTNINNNWTEFNWDLVFMHELGHALGLRHSNGKIATMNSFYPNSGPVGHYNTVTPHSDDRHGLRYLYPDNTTEKDLAALRFRNSSRSTFNNAVTINGGEIQTLHKGNTYQIQYAVDNLGTNTETAQVDFYISNNTYISTSDTNIGGIILSSIQEGVSLSGTADITIPTNLANGTYYIGFKVDPNNNILESDEYNNIVSLAREYIIINP